MPQGIYLGPPGLARQTIYDTFRLLNQRVLYSKLIASSKPDYARIRAPLPPPTSRGLVISSKA